MNREQRRAAQRFAGRVHFAGAKQTHKLAPQPCAIYIPAMREYLRDITATAVLTVDDAAKALHLCEDHAAETAAGLFSRFQIRAEVRPFHGRRAALFSC